MGGTAMGFAHAGNFLHGGLAPGDRLDDADEAALADFQFDLGPLGDGEGGHGDLPVRLGLRPAGRCWP